MAIRVRVKNRLPIAVVRAFPEQLRQAFRTVAPRALRLAKASRRYQDRTGQTTEGLRARTVRSRRGLVAILSAEARETRGRFQPVPAALEFGAKRLKGRTGRVTGRINRMRPKLFLRRAMRASVREFRSTVIRLRGFLQRRR